MTNTAISLNAHTQLFTWLFSNAVYCSTLVQTVTFHSLYSQVIFPADIHGLPGSGSHSNTFLGKFYPADLATQSRMKVYTTS